MRLWERANLHHGRSAAQADVTAADSKATEKPSAEFVLRQGGVHGPQESDLVTSPTRSTAICQHQLLSHREIIRDEPQIFVLDQAEKYTQVLLGLPFVYCGQWSMKIVTPGGGACGNVIPLTGA